MKKELSHGLIIAILLIGIVILKVALNSNINRTENLATANIIKNIPTTNKVEPVKCTPAVPVNLKRGDKGLNVTSLKISLMNLGIKSDLLTDVYTQETFKSVQNFQKIYGKKGIKDPSGIVGNDTKNLINKLFGCNTSNSTVASTTIDSKYLTQKTSSGTIARKSAPSKEVFATAFFTSFNETFVDSSDGADKEITESFSTTANHPSSINENNYTSSYIAKSSGCISTVDYPGLGTGSCNGVVTGEPWTIPFRYAYQGYYKMITKMGTGYTEWINLFAGDTKRVSVSYTGTPVISTYTSPFYDNPEYNWSIQYQNELYHFDPDKSYVFNIPIRASKIKPWSSMDSESEKYWISGVDGFYLDPRDISCRDITVGGLKTIKIKSLPDGNCYAKIITKGNSVVSVLPKINTSLYSYAIGGNLSIYGDGMPFEGGYYGYESTDKPNVTKIIPVTASGNIGINNTANKAASGTSLFNPKGQISVSIDNMEDLINPVLSISSDTYQSTVEPSYIDGLNIIFTIPEDVPNGTYNIYVSGDNSDWSPAYPLFISNTRPVTMPVADMVPVNISSEIDSLGIIMYTYSIQGKPSTDYRISPDTTEPVRNFLSKIVISTDNNGYGSFTTTIVPVYKLYKAVEILNVAI